MNKRAKEEYFDKTGKQILIGDLLRIFYFLKGKTINYVYHYTVLSRYNEEDIMSLAAYYSDKSHCFMFIVVDEEKIYRNAKIISSRDLTTKRKKIKIKKQTKVNI